MTTEHKYFTEAEAVALAVQHHIFQAVDGRFWLDATELHALCEAAAKVGAEKAREQQGREVGWVSSNTAGNNAVAALDCDGRYLEEGTKLYTTPQPAAQDKLREAEPQKGKVWAIDHSAGRPILVLNGCSVIEAEDAEYVLSLVRSAALTNKEQA